MPVVIISFVIIQCAINFPLHAKESGCIDWPRVMALAELKRMSGDATVLVEQFGDYTKKGGDGWLNRGLSFYLTDLMRTSSNLKVLSGMTAAAGVSSNTPDFTVGGSFQHIGETLRVFISFTNNKESRLARQFEAVFPYPENRDFFVKLAQVAKEILETIKVKYDRGAFSAIRDATDSTQAYEGYSKGREAFETYAPSKAEVASMWFREAKRIDYRSPLGYIGLVNLYSFLALHNKQQDSEFAPFFQKAEEEIILMAKLVSKDYPVPLLKKTRAGKKGPKLASRFLAGNIAYAEGMAAFKAMDYGTAARTLKRAAEYVPEDAMSWYYLAQAEMKLGNTSASVESLSKAHEINPCQEGQEK